MIARWSCIVMTMLCCLVDFAALAAADSVWFLWQSVTYPALSKHAGQRWDIGPGFPKFEACSAFLDRMARFDPEAAPQAGQEFTIRVNESKVLMNLGIEDEPGRWYQMELSCLPETVDPRR
jgi:hypothetical protein